MTPNPNLIVQAHTDTQEHPQVEGQQPVSIPSLQSLHPSDPSRRPVQTSVCKSGRKEDNSGRDDRIPSSQNPTRQHTPYLLPWHDDPRPLMMMMMIKTQSLCSANSQNSAQGKKRKKEVRVLSR
ncbi:hypothetical protein BP00DRAFT_263656 [Aspergillus indologenus CBS 114.80]|uniref:Uncharacterized protein n=1 Tax=Aspergillus indologenus CBS 114.80 TaxID=1450541 RepID=A0A2V5IIK2_9EURO|nr:hypothetical protein BP00DRAFT_263656 [Aspergillus indologenus CBS 114.80]